MSKQALNLESFIEFMRIHLDDNFDTLKRERLKYRDPKSMQAQILNLLIKAKQPRPQTFNRSEELSKLPDSYNVPAAYVQALESFKVETIQRQLTQSEESLGHIRRLKNLKDYKELHQKYRSSLHVDLLKEQGEVLKSVGELAEASDSFHHFYHLSETSASALNATGVIGGMVANTLGLFINLGRCIQQRRMPNDFEKAKITFSSAILTLGVLVLTGLGGPIGVSIFSASAIVLAFSKSIFELVRDSFRHRSARLKVEQYEQRRQQLLNELQNLIPQCEAVKHPSIGKWSQFVALFQKVQATQGQLAHLDQRLGRCLLKLKVFDERQQSRLQQLRKMGIIFGGSISIIGVILSFTPVSPIGFALIGCGALVTLVADLGTRIGKFLQRRRNRCLDLLHQDESACATALDKYGESNTNNELNSLLPSGASETPVSSVSCPTELSAQSPIVTEQEDNSSHPHPG